MSSFDGDANAIITNFLTGPATPPVEFRQLGAALTFVTSTQSNGHARSAVLSSGMHTISVVSIASAASATVSNLFLSGFFVAN